MLKKTTPISAALLVLLTFILFSCDQNDPEPIIESEYPNPEEEASAVLRNVFNYFTTNASIRTINVNLADLNFDDMHLVKREGEIQMKLIKGDQLEDAGAIFDIIFLNYKATDLTTTKYILLNGSKRYFNESGGSIFEPENPHNKPVFSRLRSFGFETFYSGSKGPITTNTARRKRVERVLVNGEIEHHTVIYGDTVINGMEGAKDWGTMRNGVTPFTNIIVEPVKRIYCNDESINVSGELLRIVGDDKKTVIFGVDPNGNLTPNCSAFGQLVISTDDNGNTISQVIPYTD